jgi:hypothetical protein
VLISIINISLFSVALSQNYFQQEVNFKIQVTLNDTIHTLSAFETVEYINNSPDTLQFLYFHLWPNGYDNNSTELAQQLFNINGKSKLFNNPELRGYIDSLDFKIDGKLVQWKLLPDHSDICQIFLNRKLKPGERLNISTPFHVKIPKGVSSRLGHIEQSYQISQWFPKPAVYDRDGWHQMSYQDQGEFYSEFGNFDVSITLPANYIVGATGNLQNNSESIMLEKLAADTNWIKSIDTVNNYFPPSSHLTKTLRYTENNIHDFAWFADKRFHILKGNVKLPDSGRNITTWILFTNEQANIWKNAIANMNDAIRYFSKLNGDYPYKSFTAVQSALTAGAGMEYPGITVIGLVKDAYSLNDVLAHEIAHSWFYSALGSNERRYPFMDEGITSMYEERYMTEQYPDKKLWENYFKNIKVATFFHIDKMPERLVSELEWLNNARDNLEQPINLPADDYSCLNYNLIIYTKAAMGFKYLRAYLGDCLFDSIMHHYYHCWKFKHPQPDDLQFIFETESGKDLRWFFCDFIGTTKRMDYKVMHFKNNMLLVKNNAELVSPLVIAGMIGDSICFEKWIDGFEGQKWISIPDGNYTELIIDPLHVTPELYRLNNNIKTSGIFTKSDSIRIQPYFTLEDPEKRYLMYIPVLNWTKENGFMMGMALHNEFFTPKAFDYFLMPFYSFNHSQLAGYGKISYNSTPYNQFIRKITTFLEATQFGAPNNQNYHKIKLGLDLYLRENNIKNALIKKVYGNYIATSDLYQIEHQVTAKMKSFLQCGFQIEKTTIINPFTLLISSESNQSFLKTSVEFNYRISYNGKNSGLDFRLFSGTMLLQNTRPLYSFAPSGRSGNELYLFEGSYPDRFSPFPSSLFSRQMTISEGGLVSPLNESLGYSNRLISLSLTSSLPTFAAKLPFKPFVNLLMNDHGDVNNRNALFYYEAGIKAGIWNFFEIYIPLIVSKNIETITSSFKDRIRLVINLNFRNQVLLKFIQ